MTAPSDGVRIVHMAAKTSELGVSALCFPKPRAINMKIATWTLSKEAVTCPKCQRKMK